MKVISVIHRISAVFGRLARCAVSQQQLRFLFRLKADVNISQGSVAANLRCDIITVRRYALHGLSYHRNSVRPSVRLSHSWTVSTWFDLRSRFLHHVVAASF